MIHRYLYMLLFCCLPGFRAGSQDTAALKWWNPAGAGCTEGQAWPAESIRPYDRLPQRAAGQVPEEVWSLSQQAAGLVVRFRTDAQQITVRYQVTGALAMPHMPATGVSGIDLYGYNDRRFLWCAGKYSFRDTIQYRFTGLQPQTAPAAGIEYRLFLPLYNGVKWLEVGVPGGSRFAAMPARKETPVVVYGTSIVQGACASRPGMAWTALLSRRLNRPVANLGFSGTGRLDEPVVKLIAGISAAVFVLDCLPNLIGGKAVFTDKEIHDRLVAAVKQLRHSHPSVPVIITDHFGYTDAAINPEKRAAYRHVNRINHQVFAALLARGVRRLYLLPAEQLHQDEDTMVDGIHPTDLGMMRYAEAYEKLIRRVLKETNR